MLGAHDLGTHESFTQMRAMGEQITAAKIALKSWWQEHKPDEKNECPKPEVIRAKLEEIMPRAKLKEIMHLASFHDDALDGFYTKRENRLKEDGACSHVKAVRYSLQEDIGTFLALEVSIKSELALRQLGKFKEKALAYDRENPGKKYYLDRPDSDAERIAAVKEELQRVCIADDNLYKYDWTAYMEKGQGEELAKQHTYVATRATLSKRELCLEYLAKYDWILHAGNEFDLMETPWNLYLLPRDKQGAAYQAARGAYRAAQAGAGANNAKFGSGGPLRKYAEDPCPDLPLPETTPHLINRLAAAALRF